MKLWLAVLGTAFLLTAGFGQGSFGNAPDFSGTITPAQITAAQNNYSPGGLCNASTVRLSSDASRNITGMQPCQHGWVILLRNVGTQDIVLKDASGSSTASYRYDFGGSDATVAAKTGVFLEYDAISARWVKYSSGGSGASAFSALTGGTNSTAAMVVGTGASLTPSGSGQITATDGDSATAFFSAGTIEVARGGTALASGTSGGILGYTGATTIASSVALTANTLVKGGGAGATPTNSLFTDDGTTGTYGGTGGLSVGDCTAANGICLQSGTIVFEGSSADASEGTLSPTNPTADRTWNLPDADATMVQADTGASTKFLTAISTQGVISKAQPAFTDLSGTASLAQGGTGATSTADDSVVVGDSGSAATARALPNCPDSLGNHLNYTTGSNSFSCGTAGNGLLMQFDWFGSTSPADSTTYYFGAQGNGGLNTTEYRAERTIPCTGTITRVDYFAWMSGTAGSSENSTIDMFYDATTSVGSVGTFQLNTNSARITAAATGLSQAVTVNHTLSARIQTPAWVTNPTSVNIWAQVLIQCN